MREIAATVWSSYTTAGRLKATRAASSAARNSMMSSDGRRATVVLAEELSFGTRSKEIAPESERVAPSSSRYIDLARAARTES